MRKTSQRCILFCPAASPLRPVKGSGRRFSGKFLGASRTQAAMALYFKPFFVEARRSKPVKPFCRLLLSTEESDFVEARRPSCCLSVLALARLARAGQELGAAQAEVLEAGPRALCPGRCRQGVGAASGTAPWATRPVRAVGLGRRCRPRSS